MKFLVVLSAVVAFAAAQNCAGFIEGAERRVRVDYKRTERRGKTVTDVTAAEISWRPQEMLADLACVDLAATVLLYKTPDGKQTEYKPADAKQRPAGAASLWSLDIKPCLKYQFAIKVGGGPSGGEAVFELPQTLGPAPAAELLDSRFTPSPPVILQPEVFAQYAVLNWEASECAEDQDIYLKETATQQTAQDHPKLPRETETFRLNDLKPCTSYDVQIVSFFGSNENDAEATFATKPRLDAAADMEVVVKAAMTSVEVEMNVWRVPCISEYEVTVCRADDRSNCGETVLIARAAAESVVAHYVKDLLPCTEYVLEVQPLYPDTEVEKKEVAFKTLSPAAETTSMGEGTVQSVSSGSVQVAWPTVTCAAAYKVYQRKADFNEDWQEVAEVEGDQLTVENLLPCTRYAFAVTAVLDGVETAKADAGDVTSDLSEDDPFEASNLVISNADNYAILSWDHAVCIDSYVVRVCAAGDASACTEKKIEDGFDAGAVEFRIDELKPCTPYSLEIIPVIPGKQFTARIEQFTTTNGVPQAPEDFTVQLDTAEDGTSVALLSWSPVQCATGYLVVAENGNGFEERQSSGESSLVFDGLNACENYFFSVSTLVAEQKSEATPTQSIISPPVASSPPVLKILSNENDNITLRLEPAEVNARCTVAEYEVGYSPTGARPYHKRVFTAAEEAEDLRVSFDGASSPHMIVQGRLRYGGTSIWSEMASSREPGDRSRISQELQPIDAGATLVPIVVGGIVGIILLILVIVFIVRKRRGRDRYDAEKAGVGEKGDAGAAAGGEETQKLNPEA